MKALVDRLSAELSERYIQYLETFLVDLWSEAGFIEFRCGFSLRRDHALRTFTLKVDADAGQTDAERELPSRCRCRSYWRVHPFKAAACLAHSCRVVAATNRRIMSARFTTPLRRQERHSILNSGALNWIEDHGRY